MLCVVFRGLVVASPRRGLVVAMAGSRCRRVGGGGVRRLGSGCRSSGGGGRCGTDRVGVCGTTRRWASLQPFCFVTGFGNRTDRVRGGPGRERLAGVGEGALAGVAGAGHDGEQVLQLAEDCVEGQAGAAAFGSRRSRVQKAWASTTRVTWRCQPVKERPSKWSRPRPVFSSR